MTWSLVGITLSVLLNNFFSYSFDVRKTLFLKKSLTHFRKVISLLSIFVAAGHLVSSRGLYGVSLNKKLYRKFALTSVALVSIKSFVLQLMLKVTR
ncbi:7111_t:CDS:2 [Funneliformis mosseae]|uniref:7111_t:CDS:1 n=1 Tax=Funneliformis mosseae TaxID=27381 RepID=A0A9N8YW04_FUNMO|nr:7111_t:CDS:2 [Funneliformis mosseae]